MSQDRNRKPASKRARPQDFQVRPRKPFPWLTVIFLLIAGGGAAGYYYLSTSRPHGLELVLKSTDKAVVVKTWAGQSVLDEGAPVPLGAAVQTRNSQKTVFRYGTAGSMRVSEKSEFTLSDSESAPKGKATVAYATVDLAKGRLWLLSSNEVQWIVRTPLAIVRPEGRVTEVDLADNDAVTVIVWQGKAELVPVKHEDRAITVGDQQEASFGPDLTLTNPHPLTLVKNDPWVAWNLLETMGKEINERPASPAGRPGQK